MQAAVVILTVRKLHMKMI